MMLILRWIATITDSVILIWMASTMLKNGTLSDEEGWILFIASAIAAINLAAMWGHKIVRQDSWIGLYLRRKKAEEVAKLKALS